MQGIFNLITVSNVLRSFVREMIHNNHKGLSGPWGRMEVFSSQEFMLMCAEMFGVCLFSVFISIKTKL